MGWLASGSNVTAANGVVLCAASFVDGIAQLALARLRAEIRCVKATKNATMETRTARTDAAQTANWNHACGGGLY